MAPAGDLALRGFARPVSAFTSSGSALSAKAVKPLTSKKRTVSSRRGFGAGPQHLHWFGSGQATRGWPEGQLRLADGSRKYIYAGNRRELVTWLQEERWRLASGMPVRARGLTLADYSTQWLEVMRRRLRPTTFAGYELCLGRAVSRLGSVPIARLTPQLIQACYAGLLAEGLTPRTVFHTHAVLHRALEQARHWGLTGGIPPALVSVPRLP